MWGEAIPLRKLTGKALWVLKIFLCVFASAVFLCACAGGRGEPAAFDPASLTWGMTEEEALEALGLSEGDVTVEEEAIPAENVTAPKTLRTMNGTDGVYYTISWDGQNMAAWNRYVREAS